MRICYLANAGAIHTLKWVNFFAQRGHEVHLISPIPAEGYAQDVQLHQLTVPLPPKVWGILRAINVVARIIKIKRLINKIQPDILEAQYIIPYGYLAIASGFHPLVLTTLGSDILIEAKRNILYRFLSKYALKRAEVVTCNSEMMKEELFKLGTDPSKIRIIYQGIDTQKFSPQARQGFKDRLGISEVPVVISTRSLRPVYNVEMLIRAVPLVLEQEPQTRFIIAGQGEQQDYFNSLASSLGILSNVQFTGWISHDELPNYLASSDVYVSTSLSDSTSLSLQEAMACELAPVVTDLPGNLEWITDGKNGFIVAINDEQALAERIIYLIKNKERRNRFGREGRKIIMARAEYAKEMEKVESLYQEMV